MTSTSQRPASAGLTACVLASILCLTGCGSADTERPAAGTSSPTAPAPTATATGPLQLGKASHIRAGAHEVSVIASEYRQPLRSQVPPRRSGYVYAGLEARVCVDRGPGPVEVSWAGWRLVFADSTSVEPVNAWSEDWFSVPLFPGDGFGKPVRVGRCVQGWVVFEVQGGVRPDLAEYAPDDAAAGPAWNL